MSTLTTERLYNLLPAIYRQRDVVLGEPLRALLAVMEQELITIEQELGGLYDNWFIETCQEWVVPYIGDLLGVSGLNDETSHLFSQRAHVANAIAYRRRKGVPAILERVAEDVTGWKARAVEYFDLLCRTQHLANVHLNKGKTFNLRNNAAIAQINTPFEIGASFVDVRRIATQRGRHNIPNAGLFLWRLSAFPINRSEPFPVEEQANGYTFHPLGVDMPLFNQPQPKRELTEKTGARHVPALLTREALKEDLERYDAGQESLYFGSKPVLQIFVGDDPLSPKEILISDLSTWLDDLRLPDGGRFSVALDPELGRLAFFETPSSEIQVSYSYGFSGNIGGGPYDRRNTLAEPNPQSWVAFVSKRYSESDNRFYNLEAAITAWAEQEQDGIIQITDNSTYDLTNDLDLSADRKLVIEAADGVRPSLSLTDSGSWTVIGDSAECQLTLNGLLLDDLTLLGSLVFTVTHSTLLSLAFSQTNPDLLITVTDSLINSFALPSGITGLVMQDSIIRLSESNQMSESEIIYGPPITLERVTLFGALTVTQLIASEVIFTEPVIVQQRQVGYVRFSYVPSGSQTPPRYRCQPDLALEDENNEEKEQAEAIELRLQPRFTSTRYGEPGYAQLSQQCALEIATGAENESEMGAFEYLLQPQRAANLKASLNEYLPIGLEAGIFYVT